jgi:hypothetical protein
MKNRLSRGMKLMGYPVQPADHGAPGVKQAAALKVKGTHEMHRFRACKGGGELPAYSGGYICRCHPLRFGKSGPPFYKVQILQQGMMIKQRPATIVGTAPTLKPIMVTGPGIGHVHIGIDIFQLFQKRFSDI